MKTKYSYTIGDTTTETLNLLDVPKNIPYDTIQFDDTVIEIIEVPQEVTLWKIRTILKLMGLEEAIVSALNTLEEPNKTAALYIWDYGTFIERGSITIEFLKQALQMTDKQVDEIFIQADKIIL